VANGHGGRRAGAGRKPHTQKYAPQIVAMHDRLADGQPRYVDNLELLADGGYNQIIEVWEPAGLITISKLIETEQGAARVTELAFPELPPEQLVCVRRTRSVAAPDRKANEYLINRVAGTPTQRVEIDPDPDGGLEVTAAAMSDAAKELAAWRQTQSALLSSLPSAPPTPPTSATST
jgi:hypothetical protein